MNGSLSGVYLIKNSINRNVYIGSAVNLLQRKGQHFSMLRSGIHKNKHLQNAWNKYGESNFCFKPILYSDVDRLIFYEQRVLDCYRKNHGEDILYNKNLVAGSMQGYKMSDGHKEKLRQCLIGNSHTLGHKLTDEHKAKICVGLKGKNLGRKYSKEARQKMSLTHIGKTLSIDSRRKLSDAVKKSWLREDIRNKRIQNNIHKKVSDKTKSKISFTLKGHPVSNETRKKMSERHKGKPSPKKGISTKPHSEEHKMKIANSMRDYRKRLQEAISK